MRKVLKNRLLLVCLLAISAVVLFKFLPLGYWQVAGHCRSESFYQGRPTSYWRQEILNQERFRALSKYGYRPTTLSERIRALFHLGEPSGKEAYELWSGDPAAIPVLIELMQDQDSTVRHGALRGLREIGDRDPRVVPALTVALRHADPLDRLQAATLLRDIGPEAKSAVPALTQALRDENEEVRERAGEALRAVDPQSAKDAGLP